MNYMSKGVVTNIFHYVQVINVLDCQDNLSGPDVTSFISLARNAGENY